MVIVEQLLLHEFVMDMQVGTNPSPCAPHIAYIWWWAVVAVIALAAHGPMVCIVHCLWQKVFMSPSLTTKGEPSLLEHMHGACDAFGHGQERPKFDKPAHTDITKFHWINKCQHSGGPWASNEAFYGANGVVTTLTAAFVESRSAKLLEMTAEACIKGAMLQLPVSSIPDWPVQCGVEPSFTDPAKVAPLPWLVTQAKGTCMAGYKEIPFPGLGRFMCAFSGTVGVMCMEVTKPPYNTQNICNPVALFTAMQAMCDQDEGWFHDGMSFVLEPGDCCWVPHGWAVVTIALRSSPAAVVHMPCFGAVPKAVASMCEMHVELTKLHAKTKPWDKYSQLLQAYFEGQCSASPDKSEDAGAATGAGGASGGVASASPAAGNETDEASEAAESQVM
jgi:hypothetical protein